MAQTHFGHMFLILAFLAGVFASIEVLDLGSLEWTLTNADQSVLVPGAVPSDVHLDLFAAQVFENPYYGSNDVNLRWIALDNWTYSTTLPDLSTWSTCYDEVYLIFNGLDTFATVTLGELSLGTVSNQFRQWTFNIRNALQSAANSGSSPVLTVAFTSAVVQANYLANLPGQEIFPNASISWFVSGNRMYIRKKQCDFGWDWGPAYAPQGVWRPVYMVGLTSFTMNGTVPAGTSAYDEVTPNDSMNFTYEVYVQPTSLYITNNATDIYRFGQVPNLPPDHSAPWIVNVSLDVLPSPAIPNSSLAMMIDIEGVWNSGWLQTKIVNTSVTGSMTIPNASVELWWPWNLGNPRLYNITVKLSYDTFNLATTFKCRIGFRTIVLNMEPILSNNTLGITPGDAWHFEINGHDMYAKGSNWIPPDAFWPRVTEDRYRQLLTSVVAGNQNPLRVWAGGAYQDDLCYDSDFLENVAAEVTYNVRRINRHPSLALWAGNNELETYSVRVAETTVPMNASLYQSQFEKLFLGVIHPIVNANSRSISWITSSTTNGYITLNPWVQRYQNVTPGYIYGDSELYDYDVTHSFSNQYYPVSRFVNEFTFHSMPSVYTWSEFNSSTILSREHHNPPDGLTRIGAGAYQGQGQMTMGVQAYYPVPSLSDPYANFSAWCWSTQLFRAEFMAREIHFYRRGSGLPNRCLGSLYWQLEDIWQAPSWAGIEYSGRWKVLHYAARNVYQPVIISPFFSGSFDVGPVNSTLVYSAGNGTDVPLLPSNTTGDNAVLSLKLTASDGEQTYTHENWFSPTYLNAANLSDPQIKLTTNSRSSSFLSSSDPTFTVSARGVAAWVFLEHPEGVLGWFSENAFLLIPGQDRDITFSVWPGSDSTEGTWADGVTVRRMWNNIYM
ncbi:glycoside hydrolase [Dacryopinax primogenitus]|uniref:Beta-mannosidase A n=1 Tax=Dacryopinax primogenitus (strain DJM 731) TaxID=1858805 RepID=M5FSG6_DACPD|nr:glycoside hydrolase [Dacryopinax primogenitus]EJT98813.1 glycoside hydrolase [Dacryopinax primogenitus]